MRLFSLLVQVDEANEYHCFVGFQMSNVWIMTIQY